MPVTKEWPLDTASLPSPVLAESTGHGCLSSLLGRKRNTHSKSSLPKLRKSKDHRLKEQRRSFVEQDGAARRLVKIELDAAEALAEFSRMAHLIEHDKPGACDDAGFPQWRGKRRRSARPAIAECCVGTRTDDQGGCGEAIEYELNSEHKGYGDGIERTKTMSEYSKESLASDSRAESPSSPLPSTRVECKSFVIGGPVANSAFQRVMPLRPNEKAYLLPLSAKIEVTQLDGYTASPQKATIKRKQRKCEPLVFAVKVKEEELDGQEVEMNATGWDLAVSDTQAKLMVQRSGYKLKTTLTEMEKEARRLRRVQANRESARQTIRKKQIQCEDLMRRAADLTLENEGMKQKKQMFMRELYFLKDQNCHLRQQLGMDPSDLGNEILQQSSTMPLWPVSLPALQLSGLPYSLPLPSFIWAVATSQAMNASVQPFNGAGTAPDCDIKNTRTLPNLLPDMTCLESRTLSDPNGNCAQQVQTCSMLVTEGSDDVGVSVQVQGIPCSQVEELNFPPNSAATETRPGTENVANVLRADRWGPCQPTKGLSSERILDLLQLSPSTKSTVVDSGTIPMATGSMVNGVSHFGQAFSLHGVSLTRGKAGVYVEGGCLFGGRTSAAAMAAAQARRRRKELTRSKFLQSRLQKLAC